MAKSPDAFVYNATLERIVDGDTFDCSLDLGFDVKLHKQRVRLAGIDTPESRTRDKVEKTYGILAKNFVKSYLKPGSTQVLQTEKDGTGKFGRILGDFSVKGARVSRVMIERHHAVEYHGGKR